MHSSILLIKLMLCDKGNELYIEIGKENFWAILFSRIFLWVCLVYLAKFKLRDTKWNDVYFIAVEYYYFAVTGS